jgi:hypothetical protein
MCAFGTGEEVTVHASPAAPSLGVCLWLVCSRANSNACCRHERTLPGRVASRYHSKLPLLDLVHCLWAPPASLPSH